MDHRIQSRRRETPRMLGNLKVHVLRGVNLAYRDARGSDPYVVLRTGSQKVKTGVKKRNVNPEWNEELTLHISDPIQPIKLLAKCDIGIASPIVLSLASILTRKTTNPPFSIFCFSKEQVYDKDRFSRDDEMGDVEIDIQPLVEASRMDSEFVLDGTTVKIVEPRNENSLVEQSHIQYKGGKMVQDMILRLQNVECGEVELQLTWIKTH